MIRIGKNLLKERALIINQQLCLANEIKLKNERMMFSKKEPDFTDLHNLQKKIQNKEKTISKLIYQYYPYTSK